MRKFGILFLALIVILFFFAGFYLFIVPSKNQYGTFLRCRLPFAGKKPDFDETMSVFSPYFCRPGTRNPDPGKNIDYVI
ncbi:MAG TPA: hypothetical protein VHE54_12065 [Puia sp.]|nr:hypothetical protein [Puia sp.]